MCKEILKEMKTAKEFLIKKYPELVKYWNQVNNTDDFMAEKMEEYAKYYHKKKRKEEREIDSIINKDPKSTLLP
jgi:hypothetical protein